MPNTACEEKLRLLIDYQRQTLAWLAFSKAIDQMAMRILSHSEYRHLHTYAEKARHSSDDARELLERHIAQHRC